MTQRQQRSFNLRPKLPVRPADFEQESVYVQDVRNALLIEVGLTPESTWQDVLGVFINASAASTIVRGVDQVPLQVPEPQAGPYAATEAVTMLLNGIDRDITDMGTKQMPTITLGLSLTDTATAVLV